MTKSKFKYILPVIHFILSFFYERLFLVFEDSVPVRTALPVNSGFSDKAEHVVAYLVSKLFAAILIFLLWKLIFYVLSNHKKTSVKVALCVFLILFAVFGVILLPDTKLRSIDNYITYLYALNLWPEYWHSAYLSMLYAACMMVLPSPAMITCMQWIGLSAVVGYSLEMVEKSPVLRGRFKWCVLAIFLIPNAFLLCADSYRTEVYAIICMFYVTVLIMDCVDGVQRNTLQMVLLAILGAFLGVFRTEGIILGVGGYIAMLIFGYKLKAQKVLALSVTIMAMYVLIALPQKIGDDKYYGKDYSIINSFPSLMNILNDERHNIAYTGVEQDFADIERVVPVNVIKLYGMEGYRRYNITCGRIDINQSCASGEDASAYMRGYYSLVRHNPMLYLKTQMNMWFKTLHFDIPDYVARDNRVDRVTPLSDFEFKIWDTGEAKYTEDLGLNSWRDNPHRKKAASAVNAYFDAYHKISFEILHTASIKLIVVLLAGAVFICRECVLFFKKRRDNTAFGVLLLILFIQYAAIVLVMPSASQIYFHATYLGMFIVEYIYAARLIGERRRA